MYLPSSLQAFQVPIIDLGSSYVSSNGISNVGFLWVTAGVGGILSLAYNETTQQVILLTTESTIFNSSLFQSPILFTMTVTDASTQCVAFGEVPIYGVGCTTVFNVSMLAIAEMGCPDHVEGAVASIFDTMQNIVWAEPQLQSFIPLVSTSQPGDAFPIGSTTVVYTLSPSVQSAVQSVASRLTCTFDVWRLCVSFVHSLKFSILGRCGLPCARQQHRALLRAGLCCRILVRRIWSVPFASSCIVHFALH